MSDAQLRELIQGEIDGDLDSHQRAQLAQRLLADAAARTEREELRRVCAALDSVPQVAPPPQFLDEVLAALPQVPSRRDPRARGWAGPYRWRYLAVAATVVAAIAIVHENARGPGPSSSELAATMADGGTPLDSVRVTGPVSGEVSLYRDGTALSLRVDLTSAAPVGIVIASDGRTFPISQADVGSRNIALPGIRARGQAVEVTFLVAGKAVSGATLRAGPGN